jgi:hypothetical protein
VACAEKRRRSQREKRKEKREQGHGKRKKEKKRKKKKCRNAPATRFEPGPKSLVASATEQQLIKFLQ